MIFTVYCSSAFPAASASPVNSANQWATQLFGYSWGRARQPGELVHLVADKIKSAAPCHPLARVFETQSWSPHPYTADVYPPYQIAAGVLEWLFVERIEGTVLLVDPTCVLLGPVSAEVKPGHASARAWPDRPRGEGPFGLGPSFGFLEGICVDRELDLAAVQLPVLIHSTDLRRIAARWLELMSLIRAETARAANGPVADADKIAYAIAAAEARIQHTPVDLGVFDYSRPIPAPNGDVGDAGGSNGKTAWDLTTYRNGDPVKPASAPPGPAQEFLTLLAELVERRAQGLEQTLLRPYRQRGVREGKILGSLFLEIPGREDTISLNSSGSAIWEICDGTRNLADINRELETRFEMPPGSLRADIEVVIKRLEQIGALRLASA
jgi:hypothetical protein